jgi:acyl transferase domain-containing protein
VLPTLRNSCDRQSDVAFLLNTLGQLWLAGVQINWQGFYADERRHRVPLPTYPFERQRYWIEPQKQVLTSSEKEQNNNRKISQLSSQIFRTLLDPTCEIPTWLPVMKSSGQLPISTKNC